MPLKPKRSRSTLPDGQQCTLPAQIPEPPVESVGEAVENNPLQKNLRRETEEFLSKHPHIYRLFVKFAKQRARTGRVFGMKLLAERVRWECGLKAGENEEYLLNNNHTAYIARRLVADYPDLLLLLRFRKVRY